MVGSRFTKLVEKHSEELSRQLALKLHASSRTKSFHKVPLEDLEQDIDVLYRNLGDWLLYRTEDDVKARYGDIGRLALALFSELEFVTSLTQFFDRAIYFALEAQAAATNKSVAA